MTASRSPRLRLVGWLGAVTVSIGAWVLIGIALAAVLTLAACSSSHGPTEAQQTAKALDCTNLQTDPDARDVLPQPHIVAMDVCTHQGRTSSSSPTTRRTMRSRRTTPNR